MKKFMTITGKCGYETLSIDKILDGIAAFLKVTELPQGSVGEFDLYKLMQCYFWDKAKRLKINEIIEKDKIRWVQD